MGTSIVPSGIGALITTDLGRIITLLDFGDEESDEEVEFNDEDDEVSLSLFVVEGCFNASVVVSWSSSDSWEEDDRDDVVDNSLFNDGRGLGGENTVS